MSPAPPADGPDRPAPDGSGRYRFRLYVAGDGPISQRVRENLRRHVLAPLGDRAEVEVVDLLRDVRRTRTDRIVATPTLVRLEPAPVVRLIGDLTDFARVRALVLTEGDRPDDVAPPPPDPDRPGGATVVRRPVPADSRPSPRD